MPKQQRLQEEAEVAVHGYLEKGAGRELSTQRYNEAATNYEQYMDIMNLQGPTELGKTMEELFPSNRDNVRILDVASGTGLAGLKMWEAGFRLIDAVDPSQGMLDVAREKRIYERLICDLVDDLHQLDIADHTYDAVTIVGGMGENQLLSGAFEEIVRVVKPGGVVVNVTRVEHYRIVEDYRTNLSAVFQKLEEDGKWKQEYQKTIPIFILDREGIVTVHRVLA